MEDAEARHDRPRTDDARAQRVQALSELARRQADEAGAGASEPLTVVKRSSKVGRSGRRRRLLVAGVTVLALVAIVGSVAGFLSRGHGHSHMAAQTPLSLTPSDEQLSCEQDIAWSPNGTQVALVGYVSHCPSASPFSYAYAPGLIVVYATKDAKAANVIHPDQVISAALGLSTPQGAVTPEPGAPAADVSHQIIQYTHMVWSKDGTQLALSFVTNRLNPVTSSPSNGAFNTQTTYGLLVVHPQSGQSRVLSHTLADGEVYSGRWNLATGSYVPLTAQEVASANSPVGWPPVALEYSWSGNGALTPQMPLAIDATPPATVAGLVGDPAGDPTFGIWQPGSLAAQPGDPAATNAGVLPGVYQFSTLFAAWSPDGSLFQEFNQGGWIETGQPAAPSLNQLQGQHVHPEPLLPVRDHGLVQAISDLTQGGAVDDALPVTLAWRPDGQVLAVSSVKHNTDGSVDPTTYVVNLYDATTGQKISVLTPHLAAAPSQEQFSFLRWSPDGKHLLFAVGNLETVTLWSSDLLPK